MISYKPLNVGLDLTFCHIPRIVNSRDATLFLTNSFVQLQNTKGNYIETFLIPTRVDFFRMKQTLSSICKAASYIPRLVANTTVLSIASYLNTLKLTKINQFSTLVTFRHDNFFLVEIELNFL